jgi:CRP-like cAMP-binding protein
MWDGDAKRKTVKALVKHLITADGITFIAGQPNAGKSAIAVNLAVCIAKGLKFAGKKTGTPKGVIYIAAEASGSIMDRFKAIKDAMFITDKQLPICVLPFVPDLATAKDRKVFIDGLKLVMDEMALTHNVPVGAIIIDTMARAFSMDDENSAAEMGRLIKAVDEMGSTLDCARILIHHMGKDVRAGMRGSTALKGAADDELNVIVSPDDRYSVTLEHEKSRNYPLQKDLAFTLRSITIGVDEDGDELTTVTASFEGEVAPKAPNQKTAKETDIAVLRALFDEPTSTQRQLADDAEVSVSTVSSSLARLKKDGLVDYDAKTKQYFLTKNGKKTAQLGGEN